VLIARTTELKSFLTVVAFLGPVCAGFVVGRIHRLQPIFAALLVGAIFVTVVFVANLFVNRGSGVLYLGGMVIVPALTAIGGLLGKLSAKSQ
jgi:hypothetical protein